MWYYVENGQQRGPVGEAELDALLQAGKINSETLIWRDGMANWQPYREVKGVPAGSASESAASAAGAPVSEAVCAECGRIFPASEVIRYGNTMICADCKPRFVQKLKEGASIGGVMDYASFGTRFAAKFVDGIILWIVQMGFGVLVGFTAGAAIRASHNNAAAIGLQVALIVGGTLFGLLYNAFFLAKFGATPGKMACKIKVVTPEGGPISFGQAMVRPLAEIVSGIICYIGYLMVLWDDEKRALHDRMCNTRVVRK